MSERYARQTQLAEVGQAGQSALEDSVVTLRCRGFARNVEREYLVRCGVRNLDGAAREAVPMPHSPSFQFAETLDIATGAWHALVAIKQALGLRSDAPLAGVGKERCLEAPWTCGALTMTTSVLGAVESIAIAAYERGQEACGYLTGPAADPLHVNGVVELENLADKYHRVDPKGHPRTGRDYFEVDALRFQNAVREMAAAGTPVKVFFHSHVDGAAYFSAEDAKAMTLGGDGGPAYPLAYLVTAVTLGKVGSSCLFVWDGERRSFEPSRFRTVEG